MWLNVLLFLVRGAKISTNVTTITVKYKIKKYQPQQWPVTSFSVHLMEAFLFLFFLLHYQLSATRCRPSFQRIDLLKNRFPSTVLLRPDADRSRILFIRTVFCFVCCLFSHHCCKTWRHNQGQVYSQRGRNLTPLVEGAETSPWFRRPRKFDFAPFLTADGGEK